MSDFIFSPIPKIPFRIVNENDELIKEYSLDVGSESYFRAVIEKGSKVVATANGLISGESTYDDLSNIVKEFIDYAFNDAEAFDFLYGKFDKNILALVELSRAVSKKGQEAFDKRMTRNSELYG